LVKYKYLDHSEQNVGIALHWKEKGVTVYGSSLSNCYRVFIKSLQKNQKKNT